jgi:chaperonin GroES
MIYPSGTKVAVRPDDVDELTDGGIFIPATVRENQKHAVTRGFIVSKGPDADVCYIDDEGVKQEMKPGDRVMYVKYAGAQLRKDRDEYRILQDVDIVCMVVDDDKEIPATRLSMVK